MGSNFVKRAVVLPGEGMTGSIGTIYDAAPLSSMPARMPPAIP